jgi:hypothetical protein
MVRRVVKGALVAAFLLPAAAGAQYVPDSDDGWGPRLRVAPFGAIAFGVTRIEDTYVVPATGEPYFSEHEVALSGGPAFGAVVDYRFSGRFSVHGGAALAFRSETDHFVEHEPATTWEQEGSRVLLAKLGLGVHLREPVSELQIRQLTASAFVAPAFLRDMPRTDIVFNGESLGASNAFGVNFGFDGELPLTSEITVQFGLEDYLVWWDEDRLARWADAFWTGALQEPATTEVSTGPTNNFLARLGVSFALMP